MIESNTLQANTVEQRLDRVLEDRGIQTELPDQPAAPERPDGEPFRADLSGVGDVIRALFYIGLAALTAWALWTLYKTVQNYQRPAKKPPVPYRPKPVMRAARVRNNADRIPDVAEAEALADQGRFAEAIHLLLQIGEGCLHRSDLVRIARSTTSREIARAVTPGSPLQVAFEEIVAGVEASLFADYPADEPLFKRCRAAFDQMMAELEKAVADAIAKRDGSSGDETAGAIR